MAGKTITQDYEIGGLGHTLFTRIDVENGRATVRQWVEGIYGRGSDHAQVVVLDGEAVSALTALTNGEGWPMTRMTYDARTYYETRPDAIPHDPKVGAAARAMAISEATR